MDSNRSKLQFKATTGPAGAASVVCPWPGAPVGLEGPTVLDA